MLKKEVHCTLNCHRLSYLASTVLILNLLLLYKNCSVYLELVCLNQLYLCMYFMGVFILTFIVLITEDSA